MLAFHQTTAAAHDVALLAVAAIDGRRGMQLHAADGHRQRRPGRRLGRRRQVRAGERELPARGERGLDVEVVAPSRAAVAL